MNEKQWISFCNYKESLKLIVDEFEKSPLKNELKFLQEKLIIDNNEKYQLENSLVYNTSYDDFTKESNIKIIVIGDNPGWEEQLEKNKKFLVGQSGRLAEGFFRRNTVYNIDFRKNVIISNKTLVHTSKTKFLKTIEKNASLELKNYLNEMQKQMAKLIAQFHIDLIKYSSEKYVPELWLVGYSELKEKGIFSIYKEELKKSYINTDYWKNVYVYQHFSMNRFSIDLNEFKKSSSDDLLKCTKLLGLKHRIEIFGE